MPLKRGNIDKRWRERERNSQDLELYIINSRFPPFSQPHSLETRFPGNSSKSSRDYVKMAHGSRSRIKRRRKRRRRRRRRERDISRRNFLIAALPYSATLRACLDGTRRENFPPINPWWWRWWTRISSLSRIVVLGFVPRHAHNSPIGDRFLFRLPAFDENRSGRERDTRRRNFFRMIYTWRLTIESHGLCRSL